MSLISNAIEIQKRPDSQTDEDNKNINTMCTIFFSAITNATLKKNSHIRPPAADNLSGSSDTAHDRHINTHSNTQIHSSEEDIRVDVEASKKNEEKGRTCIRKTETKVQRLQKSNGKHTHAYTMCIRQLIITCQHNVNFF